MIIPCSKLSLRICLLLLSFVFLTAIRLTAAERVFYAGGAGDEEFFDSVQLSDGRWLIAGHATSLSWLPSGTPITTASNPSVITSPNSSGTWIGFLLVVSSDLSTVQRCWALPKGAAENIKRIRTTEIPGDTTGDVYISGNIALPSWGDANGGYFVAKLNNNFVAGVPSGFSWAINPAARGDVKDNQPWDVGSGAGGSLLVLVTGSPHSNDWMAAEFYDGNGHAKSLTSLHAKDAFRLVLKTNSTGDFRSWTASDYTAANADTNGGLRRGRWPMDAFFDGPYGLPGNGSGRGYTGYKTGAAAGYISAVVVDRRTNEFYLGANIKTVLPSGNPDFEPWVSAYAANGAALWWTRLYSEWKDTNGNGLIDMNIDSNGDGVNDRSSEGLTSSPDQYVDGLAIDYANDQLVVNGRCHGNNTTNFWAGSGASIPAVPSNYLGFQRQFTGSGSNIHISWLGKFDLPGGTLVGATYVAGFLRDGSVNAPTAYTNPNYAGWPDVNSGWAELNTTRLKPNRITVDSLGRVYIIGTGPRLATTATAWQSLLKPPATAPWNDFARVYSSDLSTLLYATALCGQFTYANGVTTTEPQGADGVVINGIVPTPDGLLALGGSRATSGVPQGNALRTGNAPSWARTGRGATDAIVARILLP